MFDGRILGVCLLVGLLFGVPYGALVVTALIQASRSSKWSRSASALPTDATADVPRFVPAPPAAPATSCTPTQAQRNALRRAGPTTKLIACPVTGAQDPKPEPITFVSANGDGINYSIPPGARVVISYFAGYPPVVSHGTRLCDNEALRRVPGDPQVEYVATGLDSGFVYFPEPGGWAMWQGSTSSPLPREIVNTCGWDFCGVTRRPPCSARSGAR
jgi:hypothetical protein